MRIPLLLVIALFASSLVFAELTPAPTPTPAPAAIPAPVIYKSFLLKYADASDIVWMFTTSPNMPSNTHDMGKGALADYLPNNLAVVCALMSQNAVLVKADNEASLDAFGTLMSALDQPLKYVAVQLTFVENVSEDTATLDRAVTWNEPVAPKDALLAANIPRGTPAAGVRFVKGTLAPDDDGQPAKGSARAIVCPVVMIPNGSTGTVDLAGAGFAIPAVQINEVVIHPNDTVSLHVHLIGNVDPADITTPKPAPSKPLTMVNDGMPDVRLTMKDGATITAAAAQPLMPGTETMKRLTLVISARILDIKDQNDPAALGQNMKSLSPFSTSGAAGNLFWMNRGGIWRSPESDQGDMTCALMPRLIF